MKISVITVCKNAEKTLERTINAVLQQVYDNIEYIIIDGGSDDNTYAIIEKYQHQLSYFVSEVDEGVYHAMNKGIKVSTGDLIYFANADDSLYDKHIFNNLLKVFKDNPTVDLIYGDHEAYLQAGDRKIYRKIEADRVLDELICIGDQQPLQPATLFKSAVFNRVGLFNESYKIASDYDWFLRYFSNPQSHPYYFRNPIVCYQHGGLSSNIKALFTEIFEIQAHSVICQTDESIKKRLKKLEKMFIEKYDLLERTNDLSIKRLHTIDFLELEIVNREKLLLERLNRINDLEERLGIKQSVILTGLKRKLKKFMTLIR